MFGKDCPKARSAFLSWNGNDSFRSNNQQLSSVRYKECKQRNFLFSKLNQKKVVVSLYEDQIQIKCELRFVVTQKVLLVTILHDVLQISMNFFVAYLVDSVDSKAVSCSQSRDKGWYLMFDCVL